VQNVTNSLTAPSGFLQRMNSVETPLNIDLPITVHNRVAQGIVTLVCARICTVYTKGKVTVHSITGHEGPEGSRVIAIFFL